MKLQRKNKKNKRAKITDEVLLNLQAALNDQVKPEVKKEKKRGRKKTKSQTKEEVKPPVTGS